MGWTKRRNVLQGGSQGGRWQYHAADASLNERPREILNVGEGFKYRDADS